MKKLLFIAIVAIVCVGCKTVKLSEKTNLQTNTAQNMTVKESNVSKLDINLTNKNKSTVDSSKTVVDNGSSTEITFEESTTTNFSTPDSTGKQFPTSQTKTKKTSMRGEKKDLKVNQNTKSTSDQETNISDKSDYKSEASAVDKGKTDTNLKSTNTKTEETETPGWVYFVVSVSFLVLLGVIYGVLKRFGVIK